jgi:hypothetical protein
MESAISGIDYLPDDWSEEKHSEGHIVWELLDTGVFVRVKPDDLHDEYIVEAVAGTNGRGEEDVVSTTTQLDWAEATTLVATLVYSMNGTYAQALRNTAEESEPMT